MTTTTAVPSNSSTLAASNSTATARTDNATQQIVGAGVPTNGTLSASPANCTTPSPSPEPEPAPEKLFAGRRRDRFAVCVTPFNLEYERPRRLLEMIEMNRLLGAQHIYFYNYTLGRRSARLVAEYASGRFALRAESAPFGVTLVQWPVPVQVHVWPPRAGHVEEVHYFAQASMLHDCLLRATRRFEYLVYSDLDEFVVPRAEERQLRTWDDLYERYFPQTPAAFYFVRNTFYKLEFSSDPRISLNASIRALDVELLLKTKREHTIFAPYVRSKYVLYTDAVDLLGTHTMYSSSPAFNSGRLVFGGRVLPPNDPSQSSVPLVARFAPGRLLPVTPPPQMHNGTQSQAPPPAAAPVMSAPIRAKAEFAPHVALLHHYRNWETHGDVNCFQDDYLPTQFSDPLLRRVAAVRRRLPDLFL